MLDAPSTPIHPYQAAVAIVDAIVVSDGAEVQQWIAEAIRPQHADRYFTLGHLGCLGFGLGFAIGAQVARPNHPVVLVTGDGGVGFTIAEFDTMVRNQLPIVVIVMNNQVWGATRHFQEIISGPGRATSATELADTRYDEVARAFGCNGQHVTELADLKPAIEKALASGQPTCNNVTVDFAAMPPDAELLVSAF